MPTFALMLYDDPTMWRKMSPEDMQKAVERYLAWSKKPFHRDGKRLADDLGRVIRSSGGKPKVSDGPYSETKEVLGGFYLIDAADYDEAVKRALDHPHLEYGGVIEVRALFSM